MKEAEIRPVDQQEVVTICMGCRPRQKADENGNPYSHGYCPSCAVLMLLEERQNGLRDGDGKQIDPGRKIARMKIAIKIGSEIEEPEYDPKSSKLYTEGVSEMRLEKARKALEEARKTLEEFEQTEAMVFIQGNIQEYWNRVA